MTIYYVLVGLLGFVAGVCVGIELTHFGYARSVTSRAWPALQRARARFPTKMSWRYIAVVFVGLSLIFNGVTGFAQIQTRAQTKVTAEQTKVTAERVEVRASCTARQFASLVDALSDRDARAAVQTAAAIALWEGIRQGVKNQNLSGPSLMADIDAYLRQLHAAQSTRQRAAYPDPNLCRRIK